MNYEKIKKFEGKERLEELKPKDTLKRAGFKEGMTLCDIGAGTGVFAFPAAQMSKENIYALEKSDAMIEILEQRIKDRRIKNMKVKKVSSDKLPIENDTCDLTIMVTSLHHIDDKKTMVREIRRISKKNGKLLVIEFHKITSEVGPPVEMRISQEELKGFAKDKNLKTVDNFVLGENFYAYVFEL